MNKTIIGLFLIFQTQRQATKIVFTMNAVPTTNRVTRRRPHIYHVRVAPSHDMTNSSLLHLHASLAGLACCEWGRDQAATACSSRRVTDSLVQSLAPGEIDICLNFRIYTCVLHCVFLSQILSKIRDCAFKLAVSSRNLSTSSEVLRHDQLIFIQRGEEIEGRKINTNTPWLVDSLFSGPHVWYFYFFLVWYDWTSHFAKILMALPFLTTSRVDRASISFTIHICALL